MNCVRCSSNWLAKLPPGARRLVLGSSFWKLDGWFSIRRTGIGSSGGWAIYARCSAVLPIHPMRGNRTRQTAAMIIAAKFGF